MLIVAAAYAVAAAAAIAPMQVEQLVGTWNGTLTLPDSTTLEVAVRVSRRSDGQIVAVADNSTEGDFNRPVRNLTLQDGVVRFELEEVDGRAELNLSGDTLTGAWKTPQGDLPLALKRATQG